MEKAMAIKTALTLFEWDNETLAPDEAGELTASVIGVLSGEYLELRLGRMWNGFLPVRRGRPGRRELSRDGAGP